MKSLFTALFLGLFSCTACTKPVTSHPCTGTECTSVGGSAASTPVVEPDASVPNAGVSTEPTQSSIKHLEGDTWSVDVPTSWQEMKIDIEDGVLFAYVNQDLHNLFFMGKEDFAGDLNKYTEYAVNSVEAEDGKVTSNQKVKVNGKDFVVLRADGGNAALWMWITVADGSGYVFSCGGDATTATLQNTICSSVANTIHIK